MKIYAGQNAASIAHDCEIVSVDKQVMTAKVVDRHRAGIFILIGDAGRC